MDAILIFSHGSVLCGAEQNLLELAGRIRSSGSAPIVEVGFLNYSEPNYQIALQRCIEQGATRIIIAPYFLVAGRFVTHELPELINRSRQQHPDLGFVIAAPLGDHPRLADAVLSIAQRAGPPSRLRDTAIQAAQFCRYSPRCPLYMTPVCPAGHRGTVEMR